MKNKKTIFYLISFSLTLALIIAIAAGSYAYIRVTREQESTNKITTLECVSLQITSVSSNGITLSGEYPIKNTEGLTKTPYKFTIKNICSKTSAAKVNLEVLTESTLVNDSSIRALVTESSETVTDTSNTLGNFPAVNKTLETARSSYTIYSTKLSAGASKTLNLRIWLDENATSAELGKTFKGILVVTA